MLESVLQEEGERSDDNSENNCGGMTDEFDSPITYYAWEQKNKQKYLVTIFNFLLFAIIILMYNLFTV